MMKIGRDYKHRDYKHNAQFKWNFAKSLADREGNVVARFEPTSKMDSVRKAIERTF
ncbi:MAG: hypothetical protein ACOYIK_02620 [Coriobacteriales bacterium]